MKRQKLLSILVATDGSEYANKAFEYACELSLMKNIPLIIVNVVEEYASIGRSNLVELKRSSKKLLQEYKRRAESLSIRKVSTIHSVGNATVEILKIVKSKNIDTLVIGDKGKYGTPKDILGGTSYKLSHYSKCTVTIVK